MWILNARIIGYPNLTGSDKVQALQFDAAGTFQRIAPAPLDLNHESYLDLNGDFLSLGGIDLQINGALGLAFPDLTLENCDRLVAIGQFLWEQGINFYAPTLVTTSIEKFQGALKSFAKYPTPTQPEARIVGAHLEGPCLNPQKRGAHPEQFLQPLTPDVMAAVIGPYGEQVAIVTLAPELEGKGETIRYLMQHLPKAVVSLGHSLASDQEAEQAFEAGATMVTHAFNAMPPLHHRAPGLLTTALTTPQVWSGFIADGQHVAPSNAKTAVAGLPEPGPLLSERCPLPSGPPRWRVSLGRSHDYRNSRHCKAPGWHSLWHYLPVTRWSQKSGEMGMLFTPDGDRPSHGGSPSSDENALSANGPSVQSLSALDLQSE